MESCGEKVCVCVVCVCVCGGGGGVHAILFEVSLSLSLSLSSPSDVVVQIVDARNPLLFHCQDLVSLKNGHFIVL